MSLIEMLKEQAVKFGDFVLTSGKRSKYYIDIKKASTDPRILEEIAKEMEKVIADEKIDRIAGLEVGAIPIATALSLRTKIPFVIIRKEKRTHGTTSRMEGELKEGDRVIVVEDVTTTGGSVISAIKAVRENNCICEKVIVVVDRMEGAKDALKEQGVELIPLATKKDLGLE